MNVTGHERPFQLCISGEAPLRGPRLCRPSIIVAKLLQSFLYAIWMQRMNESNNPILWSTFECDFLGAEMRVLYSLKYASNLGGGFGYVQQKR